jgi:hypothetical protein
MKIQYREPTLIERMTEAITSAKRPIESIVLTQSEFNSVFSYLDKTNNKQTITYSFKGIDIKVSDE